MIRSDVRLAADAGRASCGSQNSGSPISTVLSIIGTIGDRPLAAGHLSRRIRVPFHSFAMRLVPRAGYLRDDQEYGRTRGQEAPS
jgi:hypothetical protein